VHERSRHAKECCRLHLIASEPPVAAKIADGKQQQPASRTDDTEPGRRSRSQLVEEPYGNDCADVLADAGEYEQRLGWRGGERVAR
ncbi:MAG: hypothetical protein RLZZ518_648, partial [Actinomycetota bacterium]